MQMELKRDGVWTIYDEQTQTLSDFTANILPKFKLRKEVSEDVKKSFEVIERLLIHSYYEYQFIDVAASQALRVFEMALKIRYEELTQAAWKKSQNLKALIDWHFNNNHFEVTEKAVLDHVRNVRNHLSHPERHGFGGVAMFHWFETIVDIINDLYDDPDLRAQRKAEAQAINAHLQRIVGNGAIVDLVTHRWMIYGAGVLFLDNVSQTKRVWVYFKKVFELQDQLTENVKRSNPLGILEFESYALRDVPIALASGAMKIHPLESTEDQDKFNKWVERYRSSRDDLAHNVFVSHLLQKEYEKHRRTTLHASNF